ncbi:DNA phosphorothioation-dependent restriction protein DptG [Bacteroides thetaiotaomicron]
MCFDLHTKQAIEAQLLKLNLLERRSDSGEAQYVRIIL